jgi:hypothetical protein
MRRVMKKLAIVLTVGAFCIGGTFGHSAEILKEDLSGCKLPHGEDFLPDRNAPKGYIFRFSDQTLGRNPFEMEGKRPASLNELFERMRTEGTGDLMYSPLNEGTFVAVSGKMTDLGAHFLYEFHERDLLPPSQVWGEKEKSGAGKGTPGAIEGLKEGHCYLVETVDGKLALVRLLRRQSRSSLVQWVYQPSGSRKFAIPKGEVSTVPPEQVSPRKGAKVKGKPDGHSVAYSAAGPMPGTIDIGLLTTE